MESTHAISLSVRSRTPIRIAPIEYWMIYTHLGTFIAYTSSDFPALFSLEAPLEEEPASATFSHLCDSSGRLAFQQLLIIQTLVSLINFLRSKGLVSSSGRHKMP